MTLKQKVIQSLENPWFLDFKFLFSDEVLSESLKILNYLLKEEKNIFDNKINTKYIWLDSNYTIWENLEETEKSEIKANISFEIFQEFSKLDLFYSILNHLDNVNSSKKSRDIIKKFEPKYVEFNDYIAYNKRYYDMIIFCRKNCKLDTDQKRILNLIIERYEVRWINLSTKQQEKLKKINKKLSELSIKFSNNVLDSRKEFSYLFNNIWSISDIPKDVLDEAKSKAEKKWLKWYYFDASDTSYQSVMSYCKDSNVREIFYTEKNNFASRWKYWNKEIIFEILKLRHKKANLLWFKNYSELSLVFKMAQDPKEVLSLLKDISKKAFKKAKQEIITLEKYFKISWIKSWDLAYYNRLYKEKKFSFDEKELKNYFEFNKVLAWLFQIVNKLYDLEIKELKIKSYSKDLKIYEVYKNWNLLSYFIWDYFYNENKRQWAWCDNLRPKLENISIKFIPILINVCNFQKSENWKVLLNKIDLEIMFHEFGHAIHEIVSKSKYSELSWHNVEWDFVELASQLMENWAEEKEWLDLFAKHIETWKNIPKKIINAIEKLKLYWNWNFILRQSEFAIMDLLIHTRKPFKNIKEMDEYIHKIINKFSIIKKDKSYNMYTSFSHIFAWWYAAWYYSYMWAEIIESQVWNEFKKNWIFDKNTSKRFFDTILSAWTTKPAKELFYDFIWEEISIRDFLKAKWLK